MSKEFEKHNISEPVISFINTFENNPRRFKVDKTYHGIIVQDKSTNKKFIYGNTCLYSVDKDFIDKLELFRHTIKGEYLGWMTKEEKSFVKTYFENYFRDRKERLKRIKDDRKRKQLCRDYC